MNVLAEEGRKNNIRVNTISPTAATRMTEELLPPQALALMKPESITPAVEYLLSEDAPTPLAWMFRQATCMARAEQRRKAARIPTQVALAAKAAEEKKAG